MGFTTPCLIYKNTLELQGKLKILGYVEHPTMMNVDISSQFLICNAIDCETNENLFLAIAALRDDTDDSQWFVYPPENIWFICDDDDINYARENTKDSVQAAWFHCSHKATVEELIEHFKSV